MPHSRPTVLLAAIAMIAAFASTAACHSPDRRVAVQPAPPGPIDLIRSIWGDQSGRCPKEYQFCGDWQEAVCCPFERGCCEDARGPYCCSSRERDAYGERYERYEERVEVGCANTDITCSHEGRTICCDAGDSCCAGTDGPYCCAVESRGRERRGY